MKTTSATEKPAKKIAIGTISEVHGPVVEDVLLPSTVAATGSEVFGGWIASQGRSIRSF